MRDTADPIALAREFATTSTLLLSHSSVEKTLEAVAVNAPGSVPGADSACVSVITREGALETPAFSDPRVLEVHRLLTSGEPADGPVYKAAADGSLVRIDDTALEGRWPEFSRRAEKRGVRSVVACGLHASSGLRAALVLHAAKPGAFDAQAVDTADVFAAHASAAISTSQTVESLREAVRTRQVIGEATGILMERHRIEAAAAFDMLVRTSQNLNVKLRAVAEHLVRTGQDPRELRRADLAGG